MTPSIKDPLEMLTCRYSRRCDVAQSCGGRKCQRAVSAEDRLAEEGVRVETDPFAKATPRPWLLVEGEEDRMGRVRDYHAGSARQQALPLCPDRDCQWALLRAARNGRQKCSPEIYSSSWALRLGLSRLPLPSMRDAGLWSCGSIMATKRP